VHPSFDKMVQAIMLRFVRPNDVDPEEWRGTWGQIASYIGVTPQTISRWHKSPAWQQAMAQSLEVLRPTALEVALRRLLASAEGEPGGAGVAAANSLLDRFGLRAGNDVFVGGIQERPVRIILNLPDGERELTDGDITGKPTDGQL